MIDWLRSRRVRVGKMAWFNSFVVQFPWVLPLLLSVGLYLGLQPRKLTTQQIIEKYQARKRSRNRKYKTSRPTNDEIPTEEEREALREKYAKQRAKSIEKSKAEFQEISKAELDRRAKIEASYTPNKFSSKAAKPSKNIFQQVEHKQTRESIEREKELLSLIRDRKTCERLLKGLRRQYPDETRLWIVEKAISDIERDRR